VQGKALVADRMKTDVLIINRNCVDREEQLSGKGEGKMKTDVLIIGGSASGIVTALTGKSSYPEKDVLIVRKEKDVLVPCGIPYIFGLLDDSGQNLMPDVNLKNAGVNLLVSEIASLDKENKVCKTTDGQEIVYEKLVLATGSIPLVPGWLQGADLENVFTVPKDRPYIDGIGDCLRDANRIVVIGGGFIGVELSDEINSKGHDVTIVEILPHLLGQVFDEETAIGVEEILGSRGVKIKTNAGVKEIMGEQKVSGVKLQDGACLDADAVILAMGYEPNTTLARKSGIETNQYGSVKVNEYMKTEDPDIFAVGDCAEKRDFITREVSRTMLASTACAEARITGMNLYKISTVKAFRGTIAIFSIAIGDHAFGAAGLTESAARKAGIDIVTATFEGMDRHPGKLPGMHAQTVKLVAARDSGIILGGSVAGGNSVGELVNVIGLAIQNGMTLNAVLTAQIGTHPLLTAPPTAYPLIKAAELAVKKIREA